MVSITDIVSVVLAMVAFVLHIVGTIFPYWWVVEENEATGSHLKFYYGIWAIRECVNGSCTDVRSRMHGDRAWLIGPAVLLVLASVLLLVVVLVYVFILIKGTNSSVLRKLCVLLSAGSGGIIILAVLIFYKKKAGMHPSYAPETTNGDPEWALFLSTFGGIVGVVNSILIGYVLNREHEKGKQRWLFGMGVPELEIDVNILRKGSVVQDKPVYNVSLQPDGGEQRRS